MALYYKVNESSQMPRGSISQPVLSLEKNNRFNHGMHGFSEILSEGVTNENTLVTKHEIFICYFDA